MSFTNNKVRKNSRYFAGVFNKTIISLALVGHKLIMIMPTRLYAPRWLTTISYPTHTHGIIVNYNKTKVKRAL